MTDLLPCPFCGSPAFTNRRGGNIIGQIYCKSDDCFGPRTTALCYEDSVVQWNARPGQTGDDAQGCVNSRLAEFFKWAMREGPWEGDDLDGGSVQDKAESLGLIVKTKYDPAVHGPAADWMFEAGDDYYTFAPELAAQPPAAPVEGRTLAGAVAEIRALAANGPMPAASVETPQSVYEAIIAGIGAADVALDQAVEIVAALGRNGYTITPFAAPVETEEDWCEIGDDGWLTLKHSSADSDAALKLADQIEAARDLHRNAIASDLRRRHSILMDLLAGHVDLIISALRNTRAQPQETRTRHGIYIASKVKHADRWRFMRDKVGEPIISTWIDEAGEGETSDHHDLWRRCLTEAGNCALLVVYREPDEVLKGAWVELGAALSNGVPVFAVGLEEYTIAKYRGIRNFKTMKEAMTESRKLLASSSMTRPQSQGGGK